MPIEASVPPGINPAVEACARQGGKERLMKKRAARLWHRAADEPRGGQGTGEPVTWQFQNPGEFTKAWVVLA